VRQGSYDKGIAKGNKRQISLTITPDLLRRVDEVAKRTGQGRAGIINMAIYRALEGDIFA
jgi:metal-responsive CopG/Arc/MetJ family transcriptional regulator